MPSPSGKRLDDGHATIIQFANDTTIPMWEKEPTPPGWDGGNPNNTTTMRNVSLETMAPQHLKTMTPMTIKVAYDEGALLRIGQQINQNQIITLIFPTGRPWGFWGYLREWKPDALKKGEQPTATATIQPTNQDNNGVETLPTVGTTSSTTTTSTTT